MKTALKLTPIGLVLLLCFLIYSRTAPDELDKFSEKFQPMMTKSECLEVIRQAGYRYTWKPSILRSGVLTVEVSEGVFLYLEFNGVEQLQCMDATLDSGRRSRRFFIADIK
jgi:hypothetical protein